MPNPIAEVTFDSGGKSYTFVFDFYATAILQRISKIPTSKFFNKEGEWGADDVLMVFYAGLYRHHKLSEEQVGDLIGEIGPDRAGDLIKQAIDKAAAKNEGGAARPPMAKADGMSTIS